MRLRAFAGMLVVGAIVAPATATAATAPVGIEFQAFAPAQIEVLPGDTVAWTNMSERRHTVTAVDGSFDSGDLFSGDGFSHEFDVAGSFPYHCTVHPTMTGTVDVRRVTLQPLPAAPVPAGQQVELTGRTADPATPVVVERDTGGGFRAVAAARPASGGTWTTAVKATTTADYRALAGADSSAVRRLLVSDRRVRVRATRRGLQVTVTPPAPGATVVLQLRLRERFGWWPANRARLDYLSRAEFRLDRAALARVALVDRDGWTAVAMSRVVRAGGRRSRRS
jgi:plastocyanin